MSYYKRIVICGHGASGKDHLAKDLIKEGYTYPVSYTTRPIRSTETEGVQYHFITEDTFRSFVENDKMYEYVLYENVGKNKDENWYYGRTKEDFYAGQVVIMTPAGIAQLTEDDRNESFIIYINIPEEIRLERLSERDDSDDIERRLKTDREDFAGFKEYSYEITNPNFISSNIHMMLEVRLRFFPESRNKLTKNQ